jgi:Putative Ig domain
MRARRASGVLAVAALACAVALAGGCGGGGGGSIGTTTAPSPPPPSPPPPPPPALQITSSSLPNAAQGVAYTETLQATGGTAPYTWSGLTVPAGLSLSAGGVLTGTPQYSGNGDLQVQVTDSSSPPQSFTRTVFLIIEIPLSIDLPTIQDPRVRHSYINTVQPVGGTAPFMWTLVSGPQSLPPGLTFSSDNYKGTISGIPTSAGTYKFTVQASETNPPEQTVQQSLTLTVVDIPDITATVPQGLINEPYQATLQAIGGTPPYQWNVSYGSLPPGLSLDQATGIISGTPTEAWSQGTSITVTDSASPPQQNVAAIYIRISPPLAFTQSTLPDGALSEPYPQTIPFVGGFEPYIVQVIGGALPPGVSIYGSGTNRPTFSGSPTTLGTSRFTLLVTDSESPPVTIQQPFSIRVNPALVLQDTQPPPGVIGVPYSYQFQVTGGIPPYQWSYPGPFAGLALDTSTGILSGTPTTAGTTSALLSVSDTSSPPQVAWLLVYFKAYNQLKVATSSLPTTAANAQVKMELNAFGGAGSYTWSVVSGALPAGLTMDSSGVISGQTTAAGNFTFTAEVNDAGPPAQTADQAFQLTVSNSLGRNDTPATATPLSNGTYAASISPIADPPNGAIDPDTDYYKLTANPGAIVTVEITAARLNPPSPLDSVLELVDPNGNQLTICSSDPLNASGPFGSACMNDDVTALSTTDSRLTLQVPSGNSGPLTFYAHVLDWRGDARPDMVYTITVSGVN